MRERGKEGKTGRGGTEGKGGEDGKGRERRERKRKKGKEGRTGMGGGEGKGREDGKGRDIAEVCEGRGVWPQRFLAATSRLWAIAAFNPSKVIIKDEISPGVLASLEEAPAVTFPSVFSSHFYFRLSCSLFFPYLFLVLIFFLLLFPFVF